MLTSVSAGNFIYNNYRQALAIISENTKALPFLCTKRNLTDADLERFFLEEREYLRSRKKERPEVAHHAEYMAALRRLEDAQ